jgi:hypothetical protein
LQEIDEIIEKQISPHISVSLDKITDKVKQKYGEAANRGKEEIEVLD